MFKRFFKAASKSLLGIGVILAGAGVNYVPAIGSIASPYIIKAGVGLLAVGLADKGRKKIQGKPVFDKEKAMLNKLKLKKKEES